jgi:hypothetical protein
VLCIQACEEEAIKNNKYNSLHSEKSGTSMQTKISKPSAVWCFVEKKGI